MRTKQQEIDDSQKVTELLLEISSLLTDSNQPSNLFNTQKMVWVWNVTKFILWTLEDWSQPRIAKQFRMNYGGGTSRCLAKVMNVIETKDPKFYPDLLKINELYPILSLGRSKYRLKKEEESMRREKFGTSKRALKKQVPINDGSKCVCSHYPSTCRWCADRIMEESL